MNNANLDKAMEIFALLIVGEEVSRAQHVDLYEEYQNNSEVYDILTSVLKKSNLSLYEFGDSLYVTAGEGNRIFGFTNDELKRAIGLRLNRELYLAYFIIYNTILLFYQDSGSFSYIDYVRSEDVIAQTESSMKQALNALRGNALNAVEENSFQTLAALWYKQISYRLQDLLPLPPPLQQQAEPWLCPPPGTIQLHPEISADQCG